MIELMDKYLCFSVPSYIGWYLQISLISTSICFVGKLVKNKKSHFNYFLVFYLPLLAIPWLLMTTQKEDREINEFLFLPWFLLALFFLLTRFCL